MSPQSRLKQNVIYIGLCFVPTVYPVVDVDHKQMDRHAEQWLREQECFVRSIYTRTTNSKHCFFFQEYKENFEEHGYWSLSYISSMKKEVWSLFYSRHTSSVSKKICWF